ncbi:MAG TPA: amidohydrolase family protein [Xanthobacteraceae bacterium]|nr:amidohydrolase family protein [Xanthobacteraceae bacterium]
MTRTIDTHTHVLADATIKLLQKEIPRLGLKLTAIDGDNSVLEVAGVPYRPFPRGGHDIARRFEDMNAAEVDMHVLSVSPQTWLYGQDAANGAAAAAIQNDEIARLVEEHPNRFAGIATLPMQAPEQAAGELRRAMTKLGLRGAMIGSNVGGKNLDDPSFEPVWATAAEFGAFMVVHPGNVAGADRLRSYYLGNLIGNPLDTTIAAACLIFGGVLARYPKLNFVMVHGGGFIPYQGGRWVHGWQVRPEPKLHLNHSPEKYLDRFLYDTILHSKASLEFLIAAVGAERVFLGSDYPYDMGIMDCVRHVRALDIAPADRDKILGGHAAMIFDSQRRPVAAE